MDPKLITAGELIANRYRVVGISNETSMDITYEVLDEHIPSTVRRSMLLSANLPLETEYEDEYHLQQQEDRQKLLLKTKEARILGMLHHQGIPGLHDYFRLEDTYGCLITDFVHGIHLDDIMMQTKGVLPPQAVVDWMLQTCDIFGHLHSFNPPILFRDLQPVHLFLAPDSHITLTGFGIATEYDPKGQADNVGTQGFAAPEQYEGRAEPRTDIFAIGATMHTLLTKKLPQTRAPFTFHQYPICAINPHATPDLEAVVMRCVEMQPEQRYQTVQELRTALTQLIW